MLKLSRMAINGVIAVVLVAAVLALVGDSRGLAAWAKLGADLATANTELATLQSKEHFWRSRLALLSQDAVDADMLGEIARQKSGLYRKDEIVVPLLDKPDAIVATPPALVVSPDASPLE